MALADPQSVTIDETPISLPRTGTSGESSTYRSSDGLTVLTAAHQYGKRTRRTVRLDHSKVAPDPLISDQNVKFSMSSYIVIDTPVTGFTVAEAQEVVDALTAYLTASSGAVVTQLLGGEN